MEKESASVFRLRRSLGGKANRRLSKYLWKKEETDYKGRISSAVMPIMSSPRRDVGGKALPPPPGGIEPRVVGQTVLFAIEQADTSVNIADAEAFTLGDKILLALEIAVEKLKIPLAGITDSENQAILRDLGGEADVTGRPRLRMGARLWTMAFSTRGWMPTSWEFCSH